jgi:hypothetical protein
MQVIQSSKNIPGLNAPEFENIKEGIIERWKILIEKGVIEVSDADKKVRPYFVALQGVIEHLLAYELNKTINSLVGVIHTPMPATPLCTKGEISIDFIDASIQADPLRLLTVKARTTIIRDYLYQGGDLYIVYPQDGMAKRSVDQQTIYTEELQTYPTHLFDRPLTCASIDKNLIGASYIFKNQSGKLFGFAIKMTQANSPEDQGDFGLWFGEINQTPIQGRIKTVLETVNPSLSQPILISI